MASGFVNVDVKQVQGLADILNKVTLSPSDRVKLLKSIGVELETQTQERFDTKKDPEGKPWKALAEKTKDYYIESGIQAKPPLLISGELRDTIESQVQDSWQVMVGATKIYAAIHQFGGDIKAKGAKSLFVPGYGLLQKVTIPARPYLGISEGNAADIVSITLLFIESRFPS